MATTIVVDDGFRSSAADLILATLTSQGPAELLELSSFLTKAGVTFDRASGYLVWDEATLRQSFPDYNSRNICNRVISISKQTPRALDGNTGILPPAVVLDSFALVLRQFPHVWGKPGKYSAVGHLLPLNLQWQLFKSRVIDIATPNFAYGFGFARPDTNLFRQPIWKSPFDFYGWKPNEREQSGIHPFVVDRPAGYPVLLYFVGESAEIFTISGREQIQGPVRMRIFDCVRALRGMFEASMGEALFFVDEDRLTFAAFSHHLKTSLADAQFQNVLASGLEQLGA
jgi:hypothetical protein